jgi:hypothetical protein
MLAVTLTGCGGGDASSNAHSHIRVLTRFYTRVSMELKRPPKDEAEFKDKIKATNADLSAFGADSVDELFVSERDGQPLKVVYGSPPKGSDVVVWETTGVDGKRMVGHQIGSVEEVDEAKFRELVPNP